jgi:hypothetical protein
MPSITTAVKRLLRLTCRHLGGEWTGRPFPLSPRVTGNGIQAASRSPPPRPLARPPPAPSGGGGQCMAIVRIAVHGEQELDFGEGDRVYGREIVCFRGSASMGYRPPGGGARREGGGTSPSPVPTCHRERFSMRAVDHPRLPAARAASSRPLQRGRAVHGDSPGYGARGKQDLRGVSRLKPGEGMLSRGSASMGNRPRGGGADGEGGGTSPSPVPTCHRERFSWSTPSPVSCVSG